MVVDVTSGQELVEQCLAHPVCEPGVAALVARIIHRVLVELGTFEDLLPGRSSLLRNKWAKQAERRATDHEPYLHT